MGGKVCSMHSRASASTSQQANPAPQTLEPIPGPPFSGREGPRDRAAPCAVRPLPALPSKPTWASLAGICDSEPWSLPHLFLVGAALVVGLLHAEAHL